MVKYKTIRQFSAESGYTEAAIRSKISKHIWVKGSEWVHAPDGRVLISIEGFNVWVESGASLKPKPFVTHLIGRKSSRSLSPPPLI